jgi:uncharacterized membrane protein
MIVFKNNDVSNFRMAYKSWFSPTENLDDVVVRFEKINAEDVTYTFDAQITDYDCYNRLVSIQTSVELDTGEYIMSLWTIGAYSSQYNKDDYSVVDDYLNYIAVDNANIKRENDRVEDSSGVVVFD